MATRTATRMQASAPREFARLAPRADKARSGRYTLRTKDAICRLHDLETLPKYKIYLDAVAFFALAAAAVLLWATPWWPLTIAVWLVAGHFAHTKPLAFHDATHGTLHPNRRVNDALGIFIGTFIMVPLTAFRYGHGVHHHHLCTARDPEMWPFVIPGVPRSLRIVAAALEIVFGFLYTPMLLLRYCIVADNLPPKARRRIAIEYALIVAFWSLGLGVVHAAGWWQPFLVGYVVPVGVAGTYQTLRKYTEHLGLTGDDILANTRTVAAERRLGRWLSYSMQNIVHHGTHHRYAKIPYHHLPAATPYVFSTDTSTSGTDQPRIFTTCHSAFLDMLKTLSDPKAGPQWNT